MWSRFKYFGLMPLYISKLTWIRIFYANNVYSYENACLNYNFVRYLSPYKIQIKILRLPFVQINRTVQPPCFIFNEWGIYINQCSKISTDISNLSRKPENNFVGRKGLNNFLLNKQCLIGNPERAFNKIYRKLIIPENIYVLWISPYLRKYFVW